MACSALSLPFYGYFYCVCLLHVVIDNDILQRVLKSVTKNGTVQPRYNLVSCMVLFANAHIQVVHCYGWLHSV